MQVVSKHTSYALARGDSRALGQAIIEVHVHYDELRAGGVLMLDEIDVSPGGIKVCFLHHLAVSNRKHIGSSRGRVVDAQVIPGCSIDYDVVPLQEASTRRDC